MSEITRLDFMKSSAGAAAGLTIIGALVAPAAEAEDGHSGRRPVVAYVKDPRKGEVFVMSGAREVVVRDRKLSAAIVRAAR